MPRLYGRCALSTPSLYELHQAPHRDSRGTLGNPGLGILHPRGAGDIEVDPGSVFGEFLEEHSGGNGAAPTAAGIHHVGDVRLDDLLAFVVERQAPHLLTRLLVGPDKTLIHLVVA